MEIFKLFTSFHNQQEKRPTTLRMSVPDPEIDYSDPLAVNSVLLSPTITQQQSQHIYSKWAQAGTYDKVLNHYGAVAELGKAVRDHVVDRQSLILDIGAGTGLSGQVLRDSGYTSLHALEPLKEFVEVLKSKQIYSHILPEFIGGGHQVSAPDNTYDALVSCGAFSPGHIPADSLLEIQRVVRPGGHVILVMREEYLWTVPDFKENLQQLWEQLAEDGKWTLVSRYTFPNHYLDKDGLVIVFRVL